MANDVKTKTELSQQQMPASTRPLMLTDDMMCHIFFTMEFIRILVNGTIPILMNYLRNYSPRIPDSPIAMRR